MIASITAAETKPAETRPELTASDAAALIRMARNAVEAAFRGETVDPGAGPEAATQVNVTVRVDGQVRGSMSAPGRTLAQQVRDSALRAAADQRFDLPLAQGELHRARFELWIRNDARDIPDPRAKGWFQRGIDGLSLSFGKRQAYYKPSVALTKNYKSVDELLVALARKAKLPDNAWADPRAHLQATRWEHYVEQDNGEAVALSGLRRPGETGTPVERARRWIAAGTGYLLANQLSDGSYTYRYLPLSGEIVPDAFSTVRAAGCAYAMAFAAASGDRDRRLASARAAIRSLLNLAVPEPGGALLICETPGNRFGAKLGANGLLAVAMLSPEFGEEFGVQSRGLLQTLRNAQLPDGSFRCTLGGATSEEDGSKANFYPGQALLALAIAASRGDEDARSRCALAFPYYVQHFRNAPATAFPLWQVDAWRRMFFHTGERIYADFVLEQADFLAALQNSNPGDRFFGSIAGSRHRPGTSTSVYAEAIVRALGVARALGDRDRVAQYREIIERAMQFISLLVLTEAQSAFFPSPERSIGGVCEEIDLFEVRSDFVQHLITFSLAVEDEISGLE